MKMVAFRVQHYRSILDSGWVTADDITVIVGKNESGKTSLLKALWKFRPFNDEPYDLNREWPRGHRREMATDKTAVTVRFAFSPEEREQLAAIHTTAAEITEVEIERRYDGLYCYRFLPHNPEDQPPTVSVFETLKKHFGDSPQSAFKYLKDHYTTLLKALLTPASRREESEDAAETAALRAFIYTMPAIAIGEGDALDSLQRSINQATTELGQSVPARQIVEMVHGWLPTFVYMDDYKIFKGSAQLDQVAQRKREHRLTEEDRTIMKIMEMAGLELDDEVRKVSQPDREQRILDLNDASRTLTEEIAYRWSQKKYEVLFQADGYHFITFVKDVDTHILVPLEERSKGFQWFFSFDMTFMYETNGMFQNAILLLDEPGLHLHAAAQQDLLVRIREYARHNQLLYSTHLPFMIDFTRLETIRIAEDTGAGGTHVHTNWGVADADARFTLQAAIGLSLSRQLLTDQYNLVVGEMADYWLLATLATMVADAGLPGLDERLTITPLGSAATIAFAGLLLQRRQMNVAVLTNSASVENAGLGEQARQWIQDDSRLVALDTVLELAYPCGMEEVFTEEYYRNQVEAVYRTELGAQTLEMPPISGSLVERAAQALAMRGITRFNRDRVARRIICDLTGKPISALPAPTLEKTTRLIEAINRIVNGWDAAGDMTVDLPIWSSPLEPIV